VVHTARVSGSTATFLAVAAVGKSPKATHFAAGRAGNRHLVAPAQYSNSPAASKAI